MPIHEISNSGGGVYLTNGSGSWPVNARHVYITSGGGAWTQIAQGYRLATANYVTMSANWVQAFATDKYAPTVGVAAASATAGISPGRPTTVNWTEGSGGNSYTLVILPKNLTQAIQDSPITLTPGRSGTSYLYTTPAGWHSGDDIYFQLYYQDANGYTGPITTTNTVILP